MSFDTYKGKNTDHPGVYALRHPEKTGSETEARANSASSGVTWDDVAKEFVTIEEWKRREQARVKADHPAVYGESYPGKFVHPEVREGKGVVAELRAKFPHGHPEFIPMTVGEMKLHSEKNFDYAAGGDPLGNFKRASTILGLYPGLDISDPAVIAIIHALKQLDAYLWLKAQKRDGKVEGKAARLGDISVYAKIARIIEQETEEGRGNR